MRVLKWQVPVDDDWHEIGAGRVTLVLPMYADPDYLPAGPPLVEVWTLEPDANDPMAEFAAKHRIARVYGTGMEFPGEHLGSCRDGRFVWHVTGIDTHNKKTGQP